MTMTTGKMTAVEHYEAGQKQLQYAKNAPGDEHAIAAATISQAHFAAAAVALQVETETRWGMSASWQAATGRPVKPGF